MSVDAGLDELYALPLDEFTPRRDALARELKKAGDKEAAAEVAKARKPSVAAWALNQLARAQPGDIEALGRLADDMRGAGGDDLRQLMRERRELVSRLTAATKQILRAADRAPDTHTNDIASSLEAASSDAGAAAELAAARLTGAIQASGFGDWAPVATKTKSKKAAKKSAEADEAAEVDEEAEREAEAARKEDERALAAAEKDIATAERERDKRQSAVDKAAAALAEAEAALEEAERDVADARLAAADAKAAVDDL